MEHTSSVHFDGSKALLFALRGTFKHCLWGVSAYPSVDFDFVSDFASEQLPDGYAELPALDIP